MADVHSVVPPQSTTTNQELTQNKGKLPPKIEEISNGKAHTNTQISSVFGESFPFPFPYFV